MTEKGLMIQELRKENRDLKERIKELEEEKKWNLCNGEIPEQIIQIYKDVKGCDAVNVTVEDEEGNRFTSIDFLIDGQWACCARDEKIIAWKPMPEPYRGK